jgi:hypothetical protein
MTLPTAVKDLIEGSGNTFHAKVARWFADNGWKITVSPYYLDQGQQKARELDLVAEKVSPVTDSFGRWRGEVVVRLFVECKFVAGHSVFWFTERNRVATERLVCSSGGFTQNNTYTMQHHYLASGNRVAKLFASSNARGQESEPFYKALNQALNGLVVLRNQQPLASTAARGGSRVLAVLNFPVIVCSAFQTVYAADFDGKSETSKVDDNFQLEVQYAYVESSGQPRDEFFILDLVAFDKLPSFAASIQKDAELSAFFLSS